VVATPTPITNITHKWMGDGLSVGVSNLQAITTQSTVKATGVCGKNSSVACPILLRVSLHRWRVRIFDLMQRAGPESQNE